MNDLHWTQRCAQELTINGEHARLVGGWMDLAGYYITDSNTLWSLSLSTLNLTNEGAHSIEDIGSGLRGQTYCPKCNGLAKQGYLCEECAQGPTWDSVRKAHIAE